MSDEQQTQQADDPSGPGWRDVEPKERIEQGDVYICSGVGWLESDAIGRLPSEFPNLRYRRRIEPQQPSESEPETMEQLREQVRELTRQAQLDAVELQQLREQLATTQHLAEMSRRQVADEAGKIEQLKQQLWDAVEARQKAERELKAERDNGMTALRSQNRLGQESLAEALQAWLRPVLELVAEHPEDASPLAVAVLGFLPGIASRLIEE